MITLFQASYLILISPFTFIGIALINILRVILSLMTRDIIIIWFYMEIGIIRFVLMLINNLRKKRASLRLKYFVFQALCSVFLLFVFITKLPSMMVIIILLIKIGLAPFHLWFISISKHVRRIIFMWIGVVQKLVPIFILSSVFKISTLLIMIVVLRILISTLNILLQIKLIGVLAGSRVFSSNWLVLRCGEDLWLTIKFLIVYRVLLLAVIILHERGFIRWLRSYQHNVSPYIKGEQFIMLIMLGGLPPRPLFFIKLEVLFRLTRINRLLLALLLLLCSRVSFYGYININIIKLSLDGRFRLLNKTNLKFNTLLCLLILRFLLIL